MQIYKFLCQDCGHVVISHKWNKYHIKSNSCPKCGGDMCGCPDCVSFIEEKNLINKKYFDFKLKNALGL